MILKLFRCHPKEDDVVVVVLMSNEKSKECEKNEEIEPSVNVLEHSACRTKDDTVITGELADTKDQESMNNEEIDTSVGKDVHTQRNQSQWHGHQE